MVLFSLYASGLAINDVIHSAMLCSHFWLEDPAVFEILPECGRSPTTYYRFQRLYAAPTVHQEYKSMETRVLEDVVTRKASLLVVTAEWTRLAFLL